MPTIIFSPDDLEKLKSANAIDYEQIRDAGWNSRSGDVALCQLLWGWSELERSPNGQWYGVKPDRPSTTKSAVPNFFSEEGSTLELLHWWEERRGALLIIKKEQEEFYAVVLDPSLSGALGSGYGPRWYHALAAASLQFALRLPPPVETPAELAPDKTRCYHEIDPSTGLCVICGQSASAVQE